MLTLIKTMNKEKSESYSKRIEQIEKIDEERINREVK